MSAEDRLIAECRSWREFADRTAALPTTTATGAAFARLTQLYLQTAPVYQSRLAHVWLLEDVPRAVRDQLRLPAPDEGIDLLAEDREGGYWAIQAKFRQDKDRALTRGDLATFSNLAFGYCHSITFGLVAHTSARPIKKRALLGNLAELGLETWLGLTAENWQRISAAVARRPVEIQPREPRPHQRDAVAAARRHFLKAKATRGRLIMPCGTGKSLAAFWIAEALDARAVLVAVPSLALLRQSLADWTREFLAHGETPDWLIVCCDESAGDLERDVFVGETYDLGVPATTDAAVIAAFLRRPAKGRRIVFTTYQSGERLARGAKAAGCTFDLGIFDEAHKTAGPRDKPFAALLFDTKVRVRRRLLMTATERVVRGDTDDVLSMDDESIYGARFYYLSFKEAIRRGLIADYRILTVTVSDARIRELVQRNRLVTVAADGEALEAQPLAAGVALRRAFAEYGVTHAISFHRSIKTAEEFADLQRPLNSVGELRPEITSLHVSSRKSAGERADLVGQFSDAERALLTNARCLTEGIDIPSVDCVAFADPKHSVIDTVQAAGRALRSYPGKPYGYILLPLVVPAGLSVEQFAETTAFREVARTIAALSTQDERIAEEFRGVRDGKVQQPGERIVQFGGDVPVGVSLSVAEFAAAVRARVWQRVGRANWRLFEEARAYVHGLRLTGPKQWNAYCRSGLKPEDIPATPEGVYHETGWTGFPDWLGSEKKTLLRREYRPFPEARAYVQNLRIASHEQWNALCRSGRIRADIPAVPEWVYRETGWAGFVDWLGIESPVRRENRPVPTARIAVRRVYRPFAEARAFVHGLRLESQADWIAFCQSGKKPEDIPSSPAYTYREKGWAGSYDWLGTEAPLRRVYRPFAEARAFVHGLRFPGQVQWRAFCRSGQKPEDIPAYPWQVYRETGWAGLRDWLGTEAPPFFRREYRPFAEARAFVRGLRLGGGGDWDAFCASGRKPKDIPSSPATVYRERGWSGMGDWLGTGYVAGSPRTFRPFPEARTYVHGLRLRNQDQWNAFCRSGQKPKDIPASPATIYRETGWTGFPDWLGSEKKTLLRR